MARARRNMDWGFPRWRAYGQEREAQTVRPCDREGCGQPGECPAPKSPHSNEKWWFCQEHAAEYNRNWNYFAGMSAEEAAARAAEEERVNRGFRQASPFSSTSLSPEREALATLGLEAGATETQIKSAYRKLAKQNHPDHNPNDPAAAARFHEVQKAYELLNKRGNGAGQD
ncbi:J domain-containing protein [Pedomonas mirosovicensis]|uniref:J domain-containing protein n=1 Tax=Pedomonas mirosovicensis TaxID=2908641 RepID=UPI0021671543|nr:J domain-containing protein [Pedomonas mirosovicensis]MCH8686049.1 J domain-containing protein [Pedomonas mirosovicensis]